MAGALDFLTVKGPEPASYTPPQISSDWIGNLPEDFQKGQQYGRLRQLQTMFQPGTPGAAALQQAGVAPGSLYGLLAGAGGAETVAPFAQRMQQGQIYQQLMGGGQPGGDQQSALPTGGADPRGKIPVITAAANKYGVDPRYGVAVARAEGLANFYGDGGKSGGAFQLYTGGGLGNDFQRDTGLDPLDPKNEDATIDYAMMKASQGGWGPWNGAKKIGITGFAGINRQGQQTAAAGTAQPAAGAPAPVGTSPVAPADTGAAPAAVEQPAGATGNAPFMAPQGNAAGPANIDKGAAQAKQPPPQQVAQAAPPAAPAPSDDALNRYRQAADALEKKAADKRDFVHKQGLAAAASGLAIPAESMKADLDEANKLDAKAAEYRKIVNEQTQKQLGIPIEEQTKAAGAAGEAKGKRVGEVIEAGGNARNTLNDLTTIEDAVRAGGDNVAYGPGAENWNKGKQILDRIFPQQGLAEADTIQKMNARLAAAAAKSMTARPSQLEFKTFVANNPGIMNSKEGTIALINILKQQAQHDIDLGRLANRTNPGDWPDREDRYYDENPLRSPFTGKPMTPPALPQAKMTGPEFAAWGQSMGLAPGDPIKVNGKLKHFVPPS